MRAGAEGTGVEEQIRRRSTRQRIEILRDIGIGVFFDLHLYGCEIPYRASRRRRNAACNGVYLAHVRAAHAALGPVRGSEIPMGLAPVDRVALVLAACRGFRLDVLGDQ